MTPFVIDTSVIVSALISSQPDTPPKVILESMLRSDIAFLLSSELPEEYPVVLKRPKLCKLHQPSDNELDEILTTPSLQGEWSQPNTCSDTPDVGDNRLWPLLTVSPDTVLVTGDQLLLDNPPDFAHFISPREFIIHFAN